MERTQVYCCPYKIKIRFTPNTTGHDYMYMISVNLSSIFIFFFFGGGDVLKNLVLIFGCIIAVYATTRQHVC